MLSGPVSPDLSALAVKAGLTLMRREEPGWSAWPETPPLVVYRREDGTDAAAAN